MGTIDGNYFRKIPEIYTSAIVANEYLLKKKLIYCKIHYTKKQRKCLIKRFSYKQRFISTQPQCCLRIELQMLLISCYLIPISIVITRQFLYLLYLCPCLT